MIKYDSEKYWEMMKAKMSRKGKNYIESCRLEGISAVTVSRGETKEEVIEYYKKLGESMSTNWGQMDEIVQVPADSLDSGHIFTEKEIASLRGKEGYVEPGGGMKFDGDKLRMDLVDSVFVEEIAEVLTYGAKKYEDDSWQKLENPEQRYKGAALRHMYAYLRGELVDDESGMTHLQHLATNIMFLAYFERNKE